MESCCGTVKEKKRRSLLNMSYIHFYSVCFCERKSGPESSSEGSEVMRHLNRMTAIVLAVQQHYRKSDLCVQSVQQLQRL